MKLRIGTPKEFQTGLQRQIAQKHTFLKKLETKIGYLMTRRADAEKELAVLLRRLNK